MKLSEATHTSNVSGTTKQVSSKTKLKKKGSMTRIKEDQQQVPANIEFKR